MGRNHSAERQGRSALVDPGGPQAPGQGDDIPLDVIDVPLRQVDRAGHSGDDKSQGLICSSRFYWHQARLIAKWGIRALLIRERRRNASARHALYRLWCTVRRTRHQVAVTTTSARLAPPGSRLPLVMPHESAEHA